MLLIAVYEQRQYVHCEWIFPNLIFSRLETAFMLKMLESHCVGCLGIPIVQSRIECG